MKLLLLILLLSLPLASAQRAFDFEVNNGDHSIMVEYGGSLSVLIWVMNSNTGTNKLCAMSCKYSMDGSASKYFDTLDNSGDSDTLQIQLFAPETGRDQDTVQHTITVECEHSAYALCGEETPTKKHSSITVTHTLTGTQRTAKQQAEQHLSNVQQQLSKADGQIRTIEDKIRQVPGNVLLGSISREAADLRAEHSKLEQEVATLNELLVNFQYQEAARKKIFVQLEIGEMLDEIDYILARHNAAANALNRLSEDAAEAQTLAGQLMEEPAASAFENVWNDFHSGNFQSYDLLEQRIEQAQEQLSKELNAYRNKISAQQERLQQLVFDEAQRLCDKGVCVPVGYPCETMQELVRAVAAARDEQELVHAERKQKAESVNKQIDFLNGIIEQINDQQVNVDECRGAADAARADRRKLQQAITACNDALQETDKGFLSSFFGLFTGLFFDEMESFQKQPLPTMTLPEVMPSVQNELKQACNVEFNVVRPTKTTMVSVDEHVFEGESVQLVNEREAQCCIMGECTTCCDNKCKTDPELYPIVFVHGHSAMSWNSLEYSINGFAAFEDWLTDEGYVPVGILLPESNPDAVAAGDWGKIRKPIMVRSSYYRGVYDDNGRTIGKQQDQRITTYGDRLADIVAMVKERTGRDKVILITHSMGGLVARSFINDDGAEDVHKLVTIGTPHHGTYGWLIDGLCGATHLGLPECEDLEAGSRFMEDLNEGWEALVPTLSFIGECDINTDNLRGITYAHDEVVRNYSAYVEGGTNVVIEGDCVSGTGTFHQNLVHNQEVFETVWRWLQ